MEENIKKRVEEKVYDRSSQNSLIRTIESLASDKNILSKHVERYSYEEIRRFLIASNFNNQKTAKMVHEDIRWREDRLPITEADLQLALRTGKIYLMGSDKLNNPCIYIRPNDEPQDAYYELSPVSRKRSSRIRDDNEVMEIEDYENFIMWCLEYLTEEPKQYTFIVDMAYGEFRTDILEMLE